MGSLTSIMSQVILSDENCEGQAGHIFRVLTYQGYVEMLSLELKMIPNIALSLHLIDGEFSILSP